MSHASVNSILPVEVYNGLIIDHDATERAEHLDLKRQHLPALLAILVNHGVADFVELHLLHRHFTLLEGEAVVHRTLEVPGHEGTPSIRIDIAKAVACPETAKSSLVPLLWMASPHGNLVAYEYGVRGPAESHEGTLARISPETWDAFSKEFSAYVHSAGVSDIVSLKDKNCINGGEYVVPDMRVLFRVPSEVINLQPGSGMLESGWASQGPDAIFPECTDGHVTKTRQTTAGTVAHYHVTTRNGENAFDPAEVPPTCTDAMWLAAESEHFWALGRIAEAAA